MGLVFRHGPAAAGKLTVARALQDRLGYPVFCNHLVVDLLATVFPSPRPPNPRNQPRYGGFSDSIGVPVPDEAPVRALRTCSLVIAAAAVFAALVPGTATAQPVTAGTLDVVSDPGDFVGEGQTLHYDAAAGTTFTATSDAYGAIKIEYHGPTGDGGALTFVPPTNQLFAAGTTYTIDPSLLEPTRRIEVNFRGCGFVRGSFTVADIAYLPDGSLDRFAASFEQHCNGAVEALRGRVALDVAPPGPPLTVTQTLRATGTVVKKTGVATVRGTVTCSKPTVAYVNLTLAQVRKGVQTDGGTGIAVSCGPTPTAWRARVTPLAGRYAVGTASLVTSTQARDPDTALLVVVQADRTVTLAKA